MRQLQLKGIKENQESQENLVGMERYGLNMVMCMTPYHVLLQRDVNVNAGGNHYVFLYERRARGGDLSSQLARITD